jgi:hypothetical protein
MNVVKKCKAMKELHLDLEKNTDVILKHRNEDLFHVPTYEASSEVCSSFIIAIHGLLESIITVYNEQRGTLTCLPDLDQISQDRCELATCMPMPVIFSSPLFERIGHDQNWPVLLGTFLVFGCVLFKFSWLSIHEIIGVLVILFLAFQITNYLVFAALKCYGRQKIVEIEIGNKINPV